MIPKPVTCDPQSMPRTRINNASKSRKLEGHKKDERPSTQRTKGLNEWLPSFGKHGGSLQRWLAIVTTNRNGSSRASSVAVCFLWSGFAAENRKAALASLFAGGYIGM